MRDIKFRGKRIDNGGWVYGHYCYGRLDIKGNVQHEILQQNPVGCCGEYIDPATIGQFTGLVDKNGVEIYEGDVLLHHHNRNDWQSPPVKWKAIDGEQYDSVGFEIDTECVKDAEVIGNIHDNPEILKGYDNG